MLHECLEYVECQRILRNKRTKESELDMLDFCGTCGDPIDLIEIDLYVKKLSPQKILDLIQHIYGLGEYASEHLEEPVKLTEILASTPDEKHLTYCKEQITCEDALFFLHGYGHASMDLADKLVIKQYQN